MTAAMSGTATEQATLWQRPDPVTEAHDILTEAIDRIRSGGYEVAGIVSMFSGGKDSTTLAHLFRGRVTHAGHCNTSVGVEQTRQFVRDTCSMWDVPLLEQHLPEGRQFEDYVLGRVISTRGENRGQPVFRGGFPGPAMHGIVYNWLKERSLERIRNRLVTNPYRQRVIFLTGRRAAESARRRTRARLGEIKKMEVRGSIAWVAPLFAWDALDLNNYRRTQAGFPVNEVSDNLHLSGECCCGANAKKQELAAIEFFYPDLAQWLHQLGWRALKAGVAPAYQCEWGWGWGKEKHSGGGGSAVCWVRPSVGRGWRGGWHVNCRNTLTAAGRHHRPRRARMHSKWGESAAQNAGGAVNVNCEEASSESRRASHGRAGREPPPAHLGHTGDGPVGGADRSGQVVPGRGAAGVHRRDARRVREAVSGVRRQRQRVAGVGGCR